MLFEPDFVIHVDGASRGNPGEASYGFALLERNGRVLHQAGKHIGWATNNEAEYAALIHALKYALSKKILSVEIRSDSELMVKQMLGEYKVRSENLEALYQEVRGLLQKFQWYEFKHVPREENRLADRLANKALDSYMKKSKGGSRTASSQR